MNRQLLAVTVFVLVYVWLVVSRKYRATALWLGVAALVLFPALLGQQAMIALLDFFQLEPGGSWQCINWNVVGIFAGTLLVAEVFSYSRVPAVCADVLIEKAPNVCWAILAVCAFASFVSAFAENVATVLVIAPIAVKLAQRLKVSAAPFIIGIAICSNLQGTATLIGDPPSMILAAHYKMNFNDFFWYRGRPGIFFAVQLGAVASFIVLWFIYRKYKQPTAELPREKARSWFPTIVLGLMIISLAAASFIDKRFVWFGGTTCLVAGAVSTVWLYRRDKRSARAMLRSYDWSTTFFLMGVFTMVFALNRSGVIDLAARWLYSITGPSMLGAFVLIVAGSVLLSAFIDNVPYIMAMLPLLDKFAGNMQVGDSTVLVFGLLVGSCLGGNITPIGASANIVAYGLLGRIEGKTRFIDFVKIGLPFTIVATVVAGLFIWLVWS